MNTIVLMAQRYWPLAPSRQAKRQAIKLIRARQYLQHRGIDAMAVNSQFKYNPAPEVL